MEKLTHKKGTDTLHLIQFDEDKYNEIVDGIIDKVEKSIDKRNLLKQSFGHLEYDQIVAISNSLKRGVKPKSKEGCYEVKVGKNYIPIIS